MYQWAGQCQTCELPQVCLAYTECLKHGKVMLDGRDVCRWHTFVWTADALEALLSRTNMSNSDLACERSDVTCHQVHDLKLHNCTNEGLATGSASIRCKTTKFSDFGPGITGESTCFDGRKHDYCDD